MYKAQRIYLSQLTQNRFGLNLDPTNNFLRIPKTILSEKHLDI